MLKHKLIFGLIIILPCLVYSQPKESQNLEEITLQLSWEYEFQFAGFIAAKELGFYEEVGLDVTLSELTYGKNVFDELRTGRAQYAIGNSNTVVERNNGTPIVILAVIFQHSPFVIFTSTESNIFSPPDLVGKKICIYKSNNTILYAMLQSEGVNRDDVIFVEYDQEYESIRTGEAQGTTAMLTLQPYIFDRMDIPYRIMNPQTYGIDFYSNCIITLEDELEQRPDRVKKFREASLKGWDYAMQNKSEIIDIMLRDYSPDLPKDLLEFEADAMDAIMHTDLIEIGHMNPGRWQHIIDKYKELGMIRQDFTIEGLLYDPNPEQDLAGLMRILAVLGVSLAGVSLISVSLAMFNRRLKRAEREKAKTIDELKKALAEIKTLQEMLPICASCKKIRNDGGYWENVESYIAKHTSTEFSHGICPECFQKLYPDYYNKIDSIHRDSQNKSS